MTRIDGDVHVTGTLSANALTPSDGTVTNAKVAGSAASPIDADKLEHIGPYGTDFGVDADAAPSADVSKVIYRADGNATIRKFSAILYDTGTTTDVKFDLHKASAGSSTESTILTGTLDFTHGDDDNTAKHGTLSSSALVDGDVLIAKMDYTSATGAKGPRVFLKVDEVAN